LMSRVMRMRRESSTNSAYSGQRSAFRKSGQGSQDGEGFSEKLSARNVWRRTFSEGRPAEEV
jgi:hypothetical protein